DADLIAEIDRDIDATRNTERDVLDLRALRGLLAAGRDTGGELDIGDRRFGARGCYLRCTGVTELEARDRCVEALRADDHATAELFVVRRLRPLGGSAGTVEVTEIAERRDHALHFVRARLEAELFLRPPHDAGDVALAVHRACER